MLRFLNSLNPETLCQHLRLNEVSALMDRLDPWGSLFLFLGASALMIWRLEMLERKGIEGTVLGTLVMPYCSGFSNLIFAYVMARTGGNGSMVMENCLVNNVTNLTLLIGLPAAIWAMNIFPGQKTRRRRSFGKEKIYQLNYLSLLLTLIALLFFTAVLWALARDGQLDFGDGIVLVGLFLFWQVFHVFDVLKNNVHQRRTLSWLMIMEILVVLAGGYGVYLGIERLVTWVSTHGTGFFVFENLGWLSGLLMVLPNGLLAIYYARSGRADIVYSSQVGDGHICIPMCIGLFALLSAIRIPSYAMTGLYLILGAGLIHLLFIAMMKRLPRWAGLALTGSYFFFLYKGLIQ